MELQTRRGRIELQIERARLRRLLLLGRQPREGIGEGIGDVEERRWAATVRVLAASEVRAG